MTDRVTPAAPVADLRVVVANNPSPMTGPGTNTYILGTDRLVVIDPGPDLPSHLGALDRVIAGREVSQILVTHSHVDHSALAPALSKATGAPVLAFGPSHVGRSPTMEALAQDGLSGGGEGIDADFAPSRRLSDAEEIDTGAGIVTALHTPGHMGNHLSFAWRDCIFTGDIVMGWAPSLVSPPDGDLGHYRASLARLRSYDAAVFHAGHGAPITAPAARIDALLAHRQSREDRVLAALDRPAGLETLLRQVYSDTPKEMWPAASRNLMAHLVDLHQRGLVEATPRISLDAVFARVTPHRINA